MFTLSDLDKTAQEVTPLPWSSIDATDGEAPTTWETPADEHPCDIEKLEIPDDIEEPEEPQAPERGGWTLAMLCVGLGLIAACMIIPQADANRRLNYEREKLQLDLEQIQKQVAVNQEFLTRMENDPQLTERLAQRQMKVVRAGEAVVDVGVKQAGSGMADAAGQTSPYAILKVPPAPTLKPYEPVGGTLADLCREPESRLYLLGGGMLLVAFGLVMGAAPSTAAPAPARHRDR